MRNMKRMQDGGLGVSGGERYTVSSTCTHRFSTVASDRINLTGSRGGGGGSQSSRQKKRGWD
jgi:hypothetical protein